MLIDWLGRLDRQWGAGMAASTSVTPASRLGLLWVPLLALALAGLLVASPLQERLSRGLYDLSLRAVTKPAHYDDLLVVDIDDASLRALRPRLGAWPYSLDTFALVIGYLRELGARTIAIDVVLGEHRDSEAALVRALGDRGDVALAASALKRAAVLDPPADAPRRQLSLEAVPGRPAHPWPAVTLPADPLLTALARVSGPGGVGVISTPFDSDGLVRKLPLLHEIDGRVYPSMSLATHLLATGGASPLVRSGRELALGERRWPVDEMACVAVMVPPNEDAVPKLAFSTLIAAALGMSEGAGLREQITGRTVFVGSSAFLTDDVITPQRPVSGTVLLALAHGALQRGAVVDLVAPRLGALLALIALAPSLWIWQRRRPALAHDAAASLLALSLVVAIGLGALGLARLHAGLLFPLTVVLVGFVLAALLQLRWVGLANTQLEVERAVAEAANRAKTEFLANVSHEIRTPMNALLGVAELLQRTPLDAEQRRYVDVFRRSGRTLFELINDLLDLSTIEAGRLELRPRPFSLRRLLSEQRELLSGRAADKGLVLDWQLAEDLPDAIVGDRGRLAQVLMNLIGNAIKFTPTGSVRLVVTASPSVLHFAVADTGIGIVANQQQRIFEPFTQADSSVTRAFGGTGLGLSIARSLVQQMGGRIQVDSTPGVGSTFSFELPLQPAEPGVELAEDVDPARQVEALTPAAVAVWPPSEHGHAVEAGPLPTSEPPTPSHRPFRVLLTEDNEVNVLLVRAMLERSGCELEVAPDGEAALALFRDRRFDLVLMDIQMPGIDGHAATREIRRIEAAEGRVPVAVIALTAHAFDRDAQRSLEAGCNAHLTKPISRETLLATINAFRPPSG